MSEPVFEDGAWTCPEGYAHPKCKGCGHNYFGSRPHKIAPNGDYPDGGFCRWCVEEMNEDSNNP